MKMEGAGAVLSDGDVLRQALAAGFPVPGRHTVDGDTLVHSPEKHGLGLLHPFDKRAVPADPDPHPAPGGSDDFFEVNRLTPDRQQ